HLLEALWVSWGMNKVDSDLLHRLLESRDYRVRSAAAHVLAHSNGQIEDQSELLIKAAQDSHGRVRLEAIVAASWMEKQVGLTILKSAASMPLDDWLAPSYETALASLTGKEKIEEDDKVDVAPHLKGNDKELYKKGSAIFAREGFCGTCHQPD